MDSKIKYHIENKILIEGDNNGDFYFIFDGFKFLLSKNLNTLPHITVNNVIGRNIELKKINDLIESTSNPLLINGIGGIGKTTFMKYYLEKFRNNFNFAVWVNISPNSSFERAFFADKVLIKNLSLDEDISLLPEEEKLVTGFRYILDRMKQLPKLGETKNILIIDNLNELTLMYYEDGKTGLDILQELSENWTIITTSRIIMDGFANFELDSLSFHDAKLLFCRLLLSEEELGILLSQQKNDDLRYLLEFLKIEEEELKVLIEMVGRHTLTIELLAMTYKDNFLIKDIKELTKYIEERKISKEEWQIILKISSTPTEQTIYRHLMSLFSLSGLGKYEKNLLRQLSILPSLELDGVYLAELFKVKKNEFGLFANTLSSLSKKGWIKKLSKSSFKMHQIMQEVLNIKLKPNHINCRNLIENISDNFFSAIGIGIENALFFSDFIESLDKRLLSVNISFALTMSRYGWLLDAIGEVNKGIEWGEKSLTVVQKLNKESNEYLDEAKIALNLAMVYNKYDKKDRSISLLDEVFFTLNKITPSTKGYSKLLMNAYIEKLDLYESIGDFNSVSLLIEEIVNRRYIFLEENSEQYAHILTRMINVFLQFGKVKKAKKALSKLDVEIFLSNSHYSLINFYSFSLHKASLLIYLEAFDEGLGIINSLSAQDLFQFHVIQSISLHYQAAQVYYQLGLLKESREIAFNGYEKALSKNDVTSERHPTFVEFILFLAIIYKNCEDSIYVQQFFDKAQIVINNDYSLFSQPIRIFLFEATILRGLGCFELSYKKSEQCIEIAKSYSPISKSLLIQSYNSLCLDIIKTNDVIGAKTNLILFKNLLKDYVDFVGVDHYTVATYQDTLGQLELLLGDSNKALKYFLIAAKVFETKFSDVNKNHFQLAEIYKNISKCYLVLNNAEKSKFYSFLEKEIYMISCQ